MRLAIAAAAALVAVAAPVCAEVVTIPPLKNMNPHERSAISAECDRDGLKMTCRFTQSRVRLERQPEELASELEKQLREVTPAEFTKTVCQDKTLEETFVQAQSVTDLQPKARVWIDGVLARLRAACTGPTLETMRNFGRFFLERETKTCKVSATPFTQTFTKDVSGKWVSNHGPDGLCGVVNISVLEGQSVDPKKKDGHILLWTYETRKIVTNKSVSPFCDLDEIPQVFSWKAQPKELACEFIDFGF